MWQLLDWVHDNIRLLSCLFFGGALAILTFGGLWRRKRMTRRVRRQLLWYWLILCNGSYASGYNFAHHTDVTAPALTTAVIAGGAFLGLLWHPEGDDKTPPHDGALTTQAVYWLDRRVRSAKNKGRHLRARVGLRRPHHAAHNRR